MNTADNSLEVSVVSVGKRHRVTVKRGAETLHLDTLNLSSATARKKFVTDILNKYPALDREEIDSKLIALAIPGPADTPTNSTDAEQDRLAGTPQVIIDEAISILNNPKLIQRVSDDLEAVGVAGERDLALTVYFIGVSRLLRRPLAGIIRGSSSSGKSYTVEKVASLFPTECLVHATQMTPQSLFHMKPGSLVHRWVVAGERSRLEDDDRAEATRAMREILASGKLSKLMPMKTDNGIETVTIEQEGPIAFTETTTLTNVFEEDANRCLMLQTDETPEQTKRILIALAQQQSGEREDTDRIIHIHHTLQRMLPQSALVRVPWTDRLVNVFPCERVEVRRAFPQLIALVQASALLHHKQREIGNDHAILADARDYHLARRLILKPFSQSLGGGLSDSALLFLSKLPSGEEFTAKAIAKKLHVSKSAAAGWLSELNDAGAVEQVEGARGRHAAKWKLTGKTPDMGEDLLPTKEKLFPEFVGCVDAKQIHRDF